MAVNELLALYNAALVRVEQLEACLRDLMLRADNMPLEDGSNLDTAWAHCAARAH